MVQGKIEQRAKPFALSGAAALQKYTEIALYLHFRNKINFHCTNGVPTCFRSSRTYWRAFSQRNRGLLEPHGELCQSEPCRPVSINWLQVYISSLSLSLSLSIYLSLFLSLYVSIGLKLQKKILLFLVNLAINWHRQYRADERDDIWSVSCQPLLGGLRPILQLTG